MGYSKKHNYHNELPPKAVRHLMKAAYLRSSSVVLPENIGPRMTYEAIVTLMKVPCWFIATATRIVPPLSSSSLLRRVFQKSHKKQYLFSCCHNFIITTSQEPRCLCIREKSGDDGVMDILSRVN